MEVIIEIISILWIIASFAGAAARTPRYTGFEQFYMFWFNMAFYPILKAYEEIEKYGKL